MIQTGRVCCKRLLRHQDLEMIHEILLAFSETSNVMNPNLDSFADMESAAFFYKLSFDLQTFSLYPLGPLE